MNASPLKKEPTVLTWAQSTNMAASKNDYIVHAYNTVNKTIATLENLIDTLEIDGLVLRLDYLIRTLVILDSRRKDNCSSFISNVGRPRR